MPTNKKHPTIGIIGFGTMMEAVISQALQKKAIHAKSLLSKCHRARRDKVLQKKYKIPFTGDLKLLNHKTDILFLGIKPQQMTEVLQDIQPHFENQVIWTLAAGIPTKTYKKFLGQKAKIIRIMPNTPCAVGAGTTTVFSTKSVSLKEKEFCTTVLESIGKVYSLKTEKMIHATAIAAGCAPAFIYEFMKHMQNSAQKLGLSKSLSFDLNLQTFQGAIKLLAEVDQSLDDLIKMVASPKGTTEAGLKELRAKKLDRVIDSCFQKSLKRSKELAKL